jgi:hypothetical protein
MAGMGTKPAPDWKKPKKRHQGAAHVSDNGASRPFTGRQAIWARRLLTVEASGSLRRHPARVHSKVAVVAGDAPPLHASPQINGTHPRQS